MHLGSVLILLVLLLVHQKDLVVGILTLYIEEVQDVVELASCLAFWDPVLLEESPVSCQLPWLEAYSDGL